MSKADRLRLLGNHPNPSLAKCRLKFRDRSGALNSKRGIPFTAAAGLVSRGFAQVIAPFQIQLRFDVVPSIEHSHESITIRLFARSSPRPDHKPLEPLLEMRLNCSSWRNAPFPDPDSHIDHQFANSMQW